MRHDLESCSIQVITYKVIIKLCACLDGASISCNTRAVGKPRGVDKHEGVGHPKALLVVQGVGGDETGHRLGQGPGGNVEELQMRVIKIRRFEGQSEAVKYLWTVEKVVGLTGFVIIYVFIASFSPAQGERNQIVNAKFTRPVNAMPMSSSV